MKQPSFETSRILKAPRSLVFKAWTSQDHVSKWFAPTGFSVPRCSVDARNGGQFDVCMRDDASGNEHWSRGTITTFAPNEHLVIDFNVTTAEATPLFRALTEVKLSDDPCGTRIDVQQTYWTDNPDMVKEMLRGAPIGWGQTLENLNRVVVGMNATPGVRGVVHDTFTIERVYDAPRDRVFHAFANREAKRKWFGPGESEMTLIEDHFDFRVGGKERARGKWKAGTISDFDATYLDIIPLERIVYTYVMHLDDQKISASLATIEFKHHADGTQIVLTEQGAFLDGYDDAGGRKRGTEHLLQRVADSLRS